MSYIPEKDPQTLDRNELLRRRPAQRFAWQAVIGLSILLFLAVAALLYVISRPQSANPDQKIARSRELAAISLLQVEGDPALALQISAEALDQAYTSQAYGSLMRAVQAISPVIIHLDPQVYLLSVAFSPDSKLVLTSDQTTVHLWQADSGRSVAVLPITEGQMLKPVFSSDGKKVLAISNDGIVHLWDAYNGVELAVLRGHQSLVGSKYSYDPSFEWTAFSPDGNLALTTGLDDTARLWDLQRGVKQAILSRQKGQIHRAIFSPDGKQALTMGYEDEVRLWDVQSGRELVALQREEEEVFINAVYSPDSKQVLTTSNGGVIRLWNAHSGVELAVLTKNEDGMMAMYSPDGKQVLTVGRNGMGRIWDARDGSELAAWRLHESEVISAVLSPDGIHLLTSGADHAVRLWDMKNATMLADLGDPVGFVYNLAFSADGKLALTGENGETRLWDAQTGAAIIAVPSWNVSEDGKSKFSADGRLMLTVSNDGTVRVYRINLSDLLAFARQRSIRLFTCEERVRYLSENLDCYKPLPTILTSTPYPTVPYPDPDAYPPPYPFPSTQMATTPYPAP